MRIEKKPAWKFQNGNYQSFKNWIQISFLLFLLYQNFLFIENWKQWELSISIGKSEHKIKLIPRWIRGKCGWYMRIEKNQLENFEMQIIRILKIGFKIFPFPLYQNYSAEIWNIDLLSFYFQFRHYNLNAMTKSYN